ncbi:MAG: radical SAM protein, partial [Treponema sp.]|nr:radical SAM protein [Treponema sp.]
MNTIDAYTSCLLCPRACGVNRNAGERGFCRETAELRIAAAVLHRG